MNAKTLSVVFCLIALTSGYFGQQFHEKAKSTQLQAANTRADAGKAVAALEELQTVLVPDAEQLALDKSLSKALLDIYNLRLATGVTISQVSPGKQGGGISASVETLNEAVPGTSVGSVKVTMSGAYSSYEGLLAFVKGLQQGPVALTRLKVVDRTFELSLRIYGTSN